MIHIFAVTFVDDPFTFQHSSGFVSLRPFLFHFWGAIVVGVFAIYNHAFWP